VRGLLNYYGFKIDKEVGAGYFPITGNFGRTLSCLDKWQSTNIVIKASKINISGK
jgi:hypothetical protein